jgi:hypothetical protein
MASANMNISIHGALWLTYKTKKCTINLYFAILLKMVSCIQILLHTVMQFVDSTQAFELQMQ